MGSFGSSFAGRHDAWRSWLKGLALVGWLAVPEGALAQGTAQEQDACRPDVFRLCSSYIPDVNNIVACLRAREPQLSPACHDVMFPRVADPPPKPRRKIKHKRAKT